MYSISTPSFVILSQTVLELQNIPFFEVWVGYDKGTPQPKIYFGISEEDLSLYLQTKFGAHTSIFRIWRLEITPHIARVDSSGTITF